MASAGLLDLNYRCVRVEQAPAAVVDARLDFGDGPLRPFGRTRWILSGNSRSALPHAPSIVEGSFGVRFDKSGWLAELSHVSSHNVTPQAYGQASLNLLSVGYSW